MSKWKKEPPHLKPHLGCMNCGGGEMRREKDIITVPMNTRIYGGFGGWCIKKGDEYIYCPGEMEWDGYQTLMTFENMARKEPDHDWRAVFTSPSL